MRLIDADDAIKEIKHDLESLWYASDIKRYEEGVEFAINRLEDMETIEPKQEWISVKDRMPEKMEWVLCACRGNITEVLRYDHIMDDWDTTMPNRGYFKNFVTHWMPLPEPPEMNNEEEQE